MSAVRLLGWIQIALYATFLIALVGGTIAVIASGPGSAFYLTLLAVAGIVVFWAFVRS